MTALKLPGRPFALEPEGSPPPGCRIRNGVLTLTAAAAESGRRAGAGQADRVLGQDQARQVTGGLAEA